MDILPIDGAGAPRRWLLIFRRRAKHRWINWLVPGRFKHVAAFGYVAEVDAYIFFDAWLGGTSVFIARGAAARTMMLQWTCNAVVLSMDARPTRRGFRPRMLCTGAVAHLVGVPGALLPSALFRQCLRHGAQIVDESAQPATAPT